MQDMEKVEEEELGTDEQQQEYQENENQEEEHKAQWTQRLSIIITVF